MILLLFIFETLICINAKNIVGDFFYLGAGKITPSTTLNLYNSYSSSLGDYEKFAKEATSEMKLTSTFFCFVVIFPILIAIFISIPMFFLGCCRCCNCCCCGKCNVPPKTKCKRKCLIISESMALICTLIGCIFIMCSTFFPTFILNGSDKFITSLVKTVDNNVVQNTLSIINNDISSMVMNIDNSAGRSITEMVLLAFEEGSEQNEDEMDEIKKKKWISDYIKAKDSLKVKKNEDFITLDSVINKVTDKAISMIQNATITKKVIKSINDKLKERESNENVKEELCKILNKLYNINTECDLSLPIEKYIDQINNYCINNPSNNICNGLRQNFINNCYGLSNIEKEVCESYRLECDVLNILEENNDNELFKCRESYEENYNIKFFIDYYVSYYEDNNNQDVTYLFKNSETEFDTILGVDDGNLLNGLEKPSDGDNMINGIYDNFQTTIEKDDFKDLKQDLKSLIILINGLYNDGKTIFEIENSNYLGELLSHFNQNIKEYFKNIFDENGNPNIVFKTILDNIDKMNKYDLISLIIKDINSLLNSLGISSIIFNVDIINQYIPVVVECFKTNANPNICISKIIETFDTDGVISNIFINYGKYYSLISNIIKIIEKDGIYKILMQVIEKEKASSEYKKISNALYDMGLFRNVLELSKSEDYYIINYEKFIKTFIENIFGTGNNEMYQNNKTLNSESNTGSNVDKYVKYLTMTPTFYLNTVGFVLAMLATLIPLIIVCSITCNLTCPFCCAKKAKAKKPCGCCYKCCHCCPCCLLSPFCACMPLFIVIFSFMFTLIGFALNRGMCYNVEMVLSDTSKDKKSYFTDFYNTFMDSTFEKTASDDIYITYKIKEDDEFTIELIANLKKTIEDGKNYINNLLNDLLQPITFNFDYMESENLSDNDEESQNEGIKISIRRFLNIDGTEIKIADFNKYLNSDFIQVDANIDLAPLVFKGSYTLKLTIDEFIKKPSLLNIINITPNPLNDLIEMATNTFIIPMLSESIKNSQISQMLNQALAEISSISNKIYDIIETNNLIEQESLVYQIGSESNTLLYSKNIKEDRNKLIAEIILNEGQIIEPTVESKNDLYAIVLFSLLSDSIDLTGINTFYDYLFSDITLNIEQPDSQDLNHYEEWVNNNNIWEYIFPEEDGERKIEIESEDDNIDKLIFFIGDQQKGSISLNNLRFTYINKVYGDNSDNNPRLTPKDLQDIVKRVKSIIDIPKIFLGYIYPFKVILNSFDSNLEEAIKEILLGCKEDCLQDDSKELSQKNISFEGILTTDIREVVIDNIPPLLDAAVFDVTLGTVKGITTATVNDFMCGDLIAGLYCAAFGYFLLFIGMIWLIGAVYEIYPYIKHKIIEITAKSKIRTKEINGGSDSNDLLDIKSNLDKNIIKITQPAPIVPSTIPPVVPPLSSMEPKREIPPINLPPVLVPIRIN